MRYDIVLWGATGFTGALVAEYLLEHVGVGGEVSWALAGRNQAKLEALRADLAEQDPAAEALPLVLADAFDPESLRALAGQAKVVCTTVGPYAEYGRDLVAACVEQGAHYCDLTGEPHFVRDMADQHHETAREAELRLVTCCGYDSIPSDLGCFVLQAHAVETTGEPFAEVVTYVRKASGGASGGSVATAAALLEAAQDRETRRVLAKPYSLLPEGTPEGPPVDDLPGVAWDPDEEAWTGPFLMATTNAKIVRRTHGLLGLPWGEAFRYREVASFRPGVRGALRAATVTAGLGASAAFLSRPFARDLLIGRVLPEPGEGPDEATREAGSFVFHVVGRREGTAARVEVRGDKDPGYGATAGMLAEAALCLATDDLPERYGVLTPASAMGTALVERLPRAGVTIEVLEG